MNLNGLVTFACAITCAKNSLQMKPAGVKVSLEFKSFKNPNNRNLKGGCCDHFCSRCDYYFKICLKDGVNSRCELKVTTKQWDNTNDIVFTKGRGTLGNSIDNPLVKALSSWKGKLSVSIEVHDDDSTTSDDLVDRYLIDKRVIPIAGIAQQTWTDLTVKGIPSTLKLSYSVQCNRDYYGPSCTKYCLSRDDSKGHYICNLKSGEKVCRFGWFGKDCLTYCIARDDDSNGHYTCHKRTGQKICRQGWYDTTCKTYCMACNDSRAGYSCDSNGQKICLENWYPSNQCNILCIPRNDSTSGYTCNLTTGHKTCLTGWRGPECDCSPRNDSMAGFQCNAMTGERICYPGWHGSHCNVFCIPRNDSRGHYSCNAKNGAKECLRNWFGDSCNIYCPSRSDQNVEQNTMCLINNTILCARNWYGANCSVYCEPQDDDEAHYDCNLQDGQKICHQGWHGENCSVHCIPRDNDWFGHYGCDYKGNKVCYKSWYGADCKLYCAPQNSSHVGYYKCRKDGSRTCLEHWYGTKCLRYCKGHDDDQGHYRCSTTGEIVCLEDWYSDNCTAHCKPRDDDNGHYKCDPLTGQEVCLAGWTGTSCKDKIVTQPVTKMPSASQLPPNKNRNRQARTDSSLSELTLALTLGGVIFLICITVGVAIVICSRRQTRRPAKPFPYFRYTNTSTKGSLEQTAEIIRDNSPDAECDKQIKRQSQIPNLLSEYDDERVHKDNVILQEISWNQDGSRNVDEKLVMYNNIIEKQNEKDPRVDPVTGLRDNSDWVAIFDSYRFE